MVDKSKTEIPNKINKEVRREMENKNVAEVELNINTEDLKRKLDEIENQLDRILTKLAKVKEMQN